MALYQDVLAVPIPENAKSDNKEAKKAVEKALAAAEADEDARILRELKQRLFKSDLEDSTGRESEISHRHILTRVHDIVSRAEAARLRADPASANRPPTIPIGVLSTREFEALVRTSVRVIFVAPVSSTHISIAGGCQ